jgi:hypothetical protein
MTHREDVEARPMELANAAMSRLKPDPSSEAIASNSWRNCSCDLRRLDPDTDNNAPHPVAYLRYHLIAFSAWTLSSGWWGDPFLLYYALQLSAQYACIHLVIRQSTTPLAVVSTKHCADFLSSAYGQRSSTRMWFCSRVRTAVCTAL